MNESPRSSTTEEKVAQTVLQKPMKVRVGSKEYAVAPPSTATLILVSAAVSRLPQVHLDGDKVVQEVLNIAKDCSAIGDIVATFILGAREVDKPVVREVRRTRRSLLGLLRRETTEEVRETRREQLSRELLENLSPRELQNTLAKIMATMEIGDFFGLTTFLLEINTIRPTKVVSQTAYGE